MAAYTLARLYLRNLVINPLLRNKAALASAVIIAVTLTLASVAFMLSPPLEETPSFADALHRAGINSSNAPALLGAALAVFTVYIPLYTGRGGFVADPDYELVLSQPVPIASFVLAKLFAENVQGFLAAFFLLLEAPLLFPGSKPGLTALSIIAYIVYLQAVLALALLVKAYTGRRPRYDSLLKSAVAVYIGVGVAHSLAARSISPVLAAPLLPPSQALVYSLARSATALDALTRLALTAACTALLYVLAYTLGSSLTPEDLKPPPPRRAAKRLSREIPRGRRRAVKHVVLERALIDRKQLLEAAALVLAALAGAAARRYLGGLMPGLDFIVEFLAPLLAAEAAMSVAATALASDLLALWIYRVYLVDTTALAEYLLAKYSIYLYEAAAPVAVFLAAYTWSPSYLKLLISSIPAAIVVSWAALRLSAWLMPRRRIVKSAPGGRYITESIIVTPVYLASYAAFAAAFIDPLDPYHTVLASLPAAAVAFILASTSLASSLYSCELSL